MRTDRTLPYGGGLYLTETSPDRDPLDKDLLYRDPLDRDPQDRDYPGQRPPG